MVSGANAQMSASSVKTQIFYTLNFKLGPENAQNEFHRESSQTQATVQLVRHY